MEIKFEKRQELKSKPQGALGFGRITTDYMFVADWNKEKGWHDYRIVPYGPVEFEPIMMVFHYAQETFEGLKAYRTDDDRILLFRPEMNARRFDRSNQRLMMPTFGEENFLAAVNALISVEKDWVPHGEGESLYIRPMMFATQLSLGAHESQEYKFIIILSPSGQYYPSGINPVKIFVEDQYVRATKGGTGEAKCGGNYAGSLIAQRKAEELGYVQVLWLDSIERKYVEEVGSMNVMFLIDDEVVTPPLRGTVLPGVTRDSILHILREKGYKVKEEAISIDDLMEYGKNGRLKEAWGTGTAAVVSPMGELFYKGESIIINDFKTGPLTQMLYKELTDLQWGRSQDEYGWVHEVK
ncbi:branched-chain amino acid aminotransferase [Peptoniphilaceae bacterium SGI.131]